MNVFGIILAAGEGRRALGNKLSKHIRGKPMLQWVIEKAVSSNLKGNILITGKEREFGEKLGLLYDLKTVHNPDFKCGMSSSLGKGVMSLPEKADGFAIILGDMPFIMVETINELIREFSEWPQIIIPVFQGKRGHPPIFSIEYKNDVALMAGDKGARDVIKSNPKAVKYIEVKDQGTILDVDYMTPEIERRWSGEYF